jgi:hypothetical protein
METEILRSLALPQNDNRSNCHSDKRPTFGLSERPAGAKNLSFSKFEKVQEIFWNLLMLHLYGKLV